MNRPPSRPAPDAAPPEYPPTRQALGADSGGETVAVTTNPLAYLRAADLRAYGAVNVPVRDPLETPDIVTHMHERGLRLVGVDHGANVRVLRFSRE